MARGWEVADGPTASLRSLQKAEGWGHRPHVCVGRELSLVGRRQPCVRAFSRTVPVWKPGCGQQAWCAGRERRTVYYTGFRQVYAVGARTVLRCCPGWSQLPGDQGCLSRLLGGLARVAGTHYRYLWRGCYPCHLGQAGYPVSAGDRRPDVDECQTHNGGCQHSCVNTPGSYLCRCQPGFRLHADGRTCLDVDECTTGLARCAHGCLNTRGSFKCVCHAGYELGADGRQCYRIELEIVNSCEAGNGGCSHGCSHSSEGPRCTCPSGYQLDADQKTCVEGPRACAVLELPQWGLDGQLPLVRALPHIAVLRDELHPLFQDDYVGAEEEEAEARGEHTLEEKFGERRPAGVLCPGAGAPTAPQPAPHRLCDLPLPCPSACPPDTYGKNCSFSCSCQNGGTCDPQTGACRCPPGVSGAHCEDGCPKGFYGRLCRKKCHCAHRGRCHRLYGACLCDPGLYGRFCHLACPPWAFGPGCSEECQCEQRNSQACDPRDGRCACKAGYRGERCQDECQPGSFGPGCQNACACPPGVTCNPVSGECWEQCPAGHRGKGCAQECPSGTFGVNCSGSCSCGGWPPTAPRELIPSPGPRRAGACVQVFTGS
ncbi:PREDICTED: multiple epidermal growth factor-like domains protein 6 [Condylura cristata]|uniref:multiple epidermal growth factor-like domains protein 6 n=1 Tax=Condylura cristata TaxID=143302 RepID=UPI000643CF69|nr:PREDICTED: multiple epidermal growth factor-like domains protein 6 [Condylura cristata]